MQWEIRDAALGDIDTMRSVEVAAGEPFRELGLDVIADDEPPSADELQEHVRSGTAWVATISSDVIGYALASVVDGEGHLDQVSVLPSAAGQGIGRGLIEHTHHWARAQGFDAITLTTFVDVPWNGPYYQRLGYRPLAEWQLGPQLAAIREAERSTGLELVPRLAMRYVLSGGTT